MSSFKINDLSIELQRYIADYVKIFGLKMANGFDEKRNGDFTVFPVKDKVALVRDATTAVLQPGRTGTTNFSNNNVTLASRIAEIKPFKGDLKLDEVILLGWSKAYIAQKQPSDPSDVYSFQAMTYYMSRIFAQCGKDVNQAVFKGVYNPTGGIGGINLFDGLNAKFLQGYTAVGAGGLGDIPATNVYAAAATITQANILAEIQKLVDVIVVDETLAEYVDEDATLYLPFQQYAMMQQASAALAVSNGQQVVFKDAAGEYRLTLLPNTIIKHRKMLNGTQKQFWTPMGNLFYLAPEGSADDIASITVEKQDRAIKIFLDGEAGVDYADGRLIVMNNKW